MILCPVCRSDEVFEFDSRQRVPVFMNRRYTALAQAKRADCGELRMTGCLNCSFVWNDAFDPAIIRYDSNYENDQTHSPAFRAHVEDRAQRIAIVASEGASIVEVGCGQGGFLALLARRLPGDCRLTGFDPAWRGDPGGGPAGAQLYADYFDERTASLLPVPPDIIISRHTIEHIPDPVAFLRSLKESVGRARETRIFLETPCVAWILNNGQVQDFFYEHCTLFTQRSLLQALENAGFIDVSVSHVFGGQYLWAEARLGSADTGTNAERSKSTGFDEGRLRTWRNRKSRFVSEWFETVTTAAASGPVFIWGAGGKGVTFATLIDAEGQHLAAAIDNNPGKQACFLPLTGIPVLPPDALPPQGSTIIVMNPNYLDEIASQIGDLGVEARLLALSS